MGSLILLPRTKEALAIACDPRHQPYFHTSPTGRRGLQISLKHKSKKPGNCLVSFGRDPRLCDIVLGTSKYYSHVHCYIHINKTSGELVLYDSSRDGSTELKMEDDEGYDLQGAPRRRVIPAGIDGLFGIKSIRFLIKKKDDPSGTQDTRERIANSRPSDYLSHTTIVRSSCLPHEHNTRIQPPRPKPGVQPLTKIVHRPRKFMGQGAFGSVSLTVDLDSGNLLAVKRMWIGQEYERKWKQQAKHEVLMLADLEHPHIIVFVHSQGWSMGEPIELFMQPCHGSLSDLCGSLESFEPLFHQRLQSQMLDALAYLQAKKVLHLDIKPLNILHNDMGSVFFLADFGLAKRLDQLDGCEFSTYIYMAPELVSATDGPKASFLADIWSLGVSLLEASHSLPWDLMPHYDANMKEQTRWLEKTMWDYMLVDVPSCTGLTFCQC